MLIRFDGRTAIVTGAAHGLGRAIALALAERGAHVVGCDVLADELAATAQLAAAAGGSLEARPPDGAERAAVHAMASETFAARGRIDVLVNDAGGVAGQVGRPLEQVTEADWRAIERPAH